MEGWIKLHRKFTEWEWFNVDEMVKLFIYLLLSANHETGKWRGVEIKRGQLLTGINTLHQKTKISHQTLRTCLSRLEKTGEINRQSTNKYSIITICNYDSYQNNEITTNKQTNKELTSNQQATNKQLTTNKNNKNEKNDINNINITFDVFWNLYDKKVGDKNKCEKKWNNLNNAEREKIINTLPAWKCRITDKQFQPFPETYLNQKRWNDEIKLKPKLAM